MAVFLQCSYSWRWSRNASSRSARRCPGTRPRTGPARSRLMDRTCSACALESTLRPVACAGSKVWNGNTRDTLLATGTMVTTPRPSCSAVALARSLLTIPRVGSAANDARALTAGGKILSCWSPWPQHTGGGEA